MVEESFDDAWHLIAQGKPDLAYELLKQADNPFYLGNRALSLLLLGRLEEALQDYLKIRQFYPENDGVLLSTGVVQWWLKRQEEAVKTWEGAIKVKYTDAAGGVEVPAFLYFAATMLRQEGLEAQAVRLLRKRWKPSLATVWPGPIAGYLLGKMDEQTFLVGQTFMQPILEMRRLCKAHFWVGLSANRSGDKQGYYEQLSAAVKTRSGEHIAVILEPEYWLARAELSLRFRGGEETEGRGTGGG